MNESSGFDPYQSPSPVETSTPQVPVQATHSTALADPRLLGNVAVACISIQVLVKFAMVPQVQTMEWFFVVTTAHMAAFVASIITFLMWLFRVASNVRRLNPHLRINPGWVLGSYFIPFVNWVMPIISMRDIIQGSFIHAKPGALKTIAVVWWLSFVFSGVAQRFSRTDPVIMGVWLLTITVSWICVSVLVTRISRFQAAFRWSDHPRSQRPMMVPLGSSRTGGIPASRVPARSNPRSRTLEESDIESEWGRG